tara:strand:- start:4861 stop:5841 length:981 start_codon:yes stop_codon:yes gene_type:complete
MSKCVFIEECKGKAKYGKYCYKHRENYLKVDGKINIFNFTCKCSDYLKKDLVDYHNRYFDDIKSSPKLYYFERVLKLKESLGNYKDNNKEITKIQSLFRMKNILKKLRKDCKNHEDFYTYDPLIDIDEKYYYSYKDKSGFKWGFDIRSLYKLLEKSKNNPYTMEEIPDKKIKEIHDIVKKLKKEREYSNIIDNSNNYIIDHIKQKCVDLFIRIENIGHSCSIEWFMGLNKYLLIKLYRNMEDIWNYRASLNINKKKSMVPPHGVLFRMTNETLNRLSREDLLSIILNEVIKFESGSDVKLGYLFFIIGLGSVNQECYNTHNWLSFV